jgi:hypothetical protein
VYGGGGGGDDDTGSKTCDDYCNFDNSDAGEDNFS